MQYTLVVIFLLSASFDRTNSDNHNSVTYDLKCSARGFDPVFTYTNHERTDVTVDVFLGNQSESSSCTARKTLTKDDETAAVTKLDFDSRFQTEIPFSDGDGFSCDGSFSNYEDEEGEKKLKFETVATIIDTRLYRNTIIRKTKRLHTFECHVIRSLIVSLVNQTVCNIGYRSDGNACADIDECSDATLNTCHVDSYCNNTIGSYNCTCAQGYQGNGTYCSDIDECETGRHDCHDNATCNNTKGSYSCACDQGFQGDGLTCSDIDECELGTDRCHSNAECSNTIGSYRCTCHHGYEGNGFECADINECDVGSHDCHKDATCRNTNGSFECTCNHGFRGNGTHCIDRCSEIECPSFSTCYITSNGTAACRCDSGRFLREGVGNASATCEKGIQVVQISGLKVNQEYKEEYSDIKSKESQELINKVEPALLGVVRSEFGDKVSRVEVTGLRQGSVKVDFAVVFRTPIENPVVSVTNHINDAVKQGEPTLKAINVDTSSEVETYVENCPHGQFLHKGDCADVVASSRGVLTFVHKNADDKDVWGPELLNSASPEFREHLEEVSKELNETVFAHVTRISALNLSVHVLNFEQTGTDMKVVARIVYFHADSLQHRDKIELCKELREIEYLHNEKDVSAESRVHQDFQYSSFDCCYEEDSVSGDVSYKGQYTFNTSWIGDVVHKQCAYNEDGAFSRACNEVVEDERSKEAEWEDGEGWRKLENCKTQKERTGEIESLAEDIKEKEICEGTQKVVNGSCLTIQDVASQLRVFSLFSFRGFQTKPEPQPQPQPQPTVNGTVNGTVTRNDTSQQINTTASTPVKEEEGEGLHNTQEVIFVKQIMENVVEKADANQTVEVMDDIIIAMSNVLNTNATIMAEAETTENTATRIVEQIEQFSEKLADVVTVEAPLNVSTPNIAALIQKLPDDIFKDVDVNDTESEAEAVFQIAVQQTENAAVIQGGSVEKAVNKTTTATNTTTTEKDEEDKWDDEKKVAEISIPRSTFTNIAEGFKGTINVMTYSKPTLFQSTQSENGEEKVAQKVDSVIVSVSFSAHEKVTGNPAIRLDLKRQNADDKNGVTCSYWKVVNDTGGYWSNEGCYVEGYNADKTVVKCACNHFTNFALLVSPEAPFTFTPLELMIITYIGVILSLIGMVLTVIAHSLALYRGRLSTATRTVRSRLPSKFLICFAVALSLLLILFLAGMEQYNHDVGCQVYAGFMQYFMLCVFTWSLVNAVHIWKAVVNAVKNFTRIEDRVYFAKANVFAWGAPAIVVVVSGFVRPENYLPSPTKKYCFVHGYPFYFGVLLPVGGIIFVNFVILIAMMITLWRRPTNLTTAEKKQETRRRIRIGISSMVLLGVTWVVGMLAVGEATYIFQLLFCIFNSLQGFFIFILYTATNPVVKKGMRKQLTRLSSSRRTQSTSASRWRDLAGSSTDATETGGPETSDVVDVSATLQDSPSTAAIWKIPTTKM